MILTEPQRRTLRSAGTSFLANALTASLALLLAPAAGLAQGTACPPPATAAANAATPDTRHPALEIRLQPDEAEAVLAILDRRAEGEPIPESAWQRLFGAEGYTPMMEREQSIDEQQGSALLARRAALRDALDAWKHVHILRAGEQELAFLPANAGR